MSAITCQERSCTEAQAEKGGGRGTADSNAEEQRCKKSAGWAQERHHKRETARGRTIAEGVTDSGAAPNFGRSYARMREYRRSAQGQRTNAGRATSRPRRERRNRLGWVDALPGGMPTARRQGVRFLPGSDDWVPVSSEGRKGGGRRSAVACACRSGTCQAWPACSSGTCQAWPTRSRGMCQAWPTRSSGTCPVSGRRGQIRRSRRASDTASEVLRRVSGAAK